MNTTTITPRTAPSRLAVRGRTPNGAAPVIKPKPPQDQASAAAAAVAAATPLAPTSRIVLGFKIERGVPLPERGHNTGGRPAKYPFAALEAGESVFVPGIKGAGGILTRLRKEGRELVSRIVTEGDARGVRVWRTA